MVMLMKYIKMIITNIKDQVIQKSISTVDISIHILTVLKIVIMYWFVVVIEKI